MTVGPLPRLLGAVLLLALASGEQDHHHDDDHQTEDASALLQNHVRPEAEVDVKPKVEGGEEVFRPSTYKVHRDRFIAEGDDILVAEMTVSQAQIACGIIDDCAGFTFEGEQPGASSHVHFKTKLVGGSGHWTVYQRLNPRALYSRSVEEDLNLAAEAAPPAPAPADAVARALSSDFSSSRSSQNSPSNYATTWIERPESYLPKGHDWHVHHYNGYMTLVEAKRLCASLSLCVGFTYKGTDSPGKHHVDFKSDLDHGHVGAGSWTSYVKVVTGASPTPGHVVAHEAARPGKGDYSHHPVEEADASEHIVMETHRTGRAEYETMSETGGHEMTSHVAGVSQESLAVVPNRGYPGEGHEPRHPGNADYRPETPKHMPRGAASADSQIASINGAKQADMKPPSKSLDESLEKGPLAS